MLFFFFIFLIKIKMKIKIKIKSFHVHIFYPVIVNMFKLGQGSSYIYLIPSTTHSTSNFKCHPSIPMCPSNLKIYGSVKLDYHSFYGSFNNKHQWSSGRIVPCHGTDPGSIPGWCNLFLSFARTFGFKQ